VRALVAHGLRQQSCAVEEAGDGAKAIQRLSSRMLRTGRPFDGVVLHHDLRGWSGLQLLDGLRGSDWHAPTIFLVDTGDVRTAVAARRRGADAIIEWPLDMRDVRSAMIEVFALERQSGVYSTATMDGARNGSRGHSGQRKEGPSG